MKRIEREPEKDEDEDQGQKRELKRKTRERDMKKCRPRLDEFSACVRIREYAGNYYTQSFIPPACIKLSSSRSLVYLHERLSLRSYRLKIRV